MDFNKHVMLHDSQQTTLLLSLYLLAFLSVVALDTVSVFSSVPLVLNLQTCQLTVRKCHPTSEATEKLRFYVTFYDFIVANFNSKFSR